MAALLDIIKKGSTNRSVTIRIVDSSDGTPETSVEHNTSGIDLWYRREGAAKTSITEAALAALTTAHTDGGIEHIGDGEYRLDLPDAAFATGANYVDVGGTVTDRGVIGGRVRLVDYDLEDSVRLGLTSLPDAAADAAGGMVISDAGGLDIDSKLATATSALATTAELDKVPKSDGSVTFNGTAIATLETAAYTALTAWGAVATTDLPSNFGSMVISGAGAVDSLVQGFLNNTIAETTANNIATNFEVFYDNGDSVTTNTVDDVGGGSGLDAAGVRSALGMSSANLDTQLADLPTVAEFEARTLVAASYFDPASDNIAGSVGSVTGGINTAAGTITTLDGLDTAQDSQHSTTQSELAKVPKSDGTTTWNATALASINAECDTAMSDYDAATGTEVSDVSSQLITINNKLGTPADFGGGATLANNIQDTITVVARIETDTQDLQTQIGTAGAGLTDLGGMSTTMKGQVNTEVDSGLSDYDALVPADLPSNFGSLVISAGGAVDSLVQGFLNNTIAETTADNISANFETFFDNGDSTTSQTVDDVGGSGLDEAGMRSALGMSSANLDTQLADLPTVAEFEARTLAAANYFDPAADTVANVTLVATTTTNTDMRGTDSAYTGTPPTAGAIADQVWEEAVTDHSGTSGSTAEALNAAGSAGDPWTTTLPGSYTGSQAGKILADALADTNELQTNQGNWLTADVSSLALEASLSDGTVTLHTDYDAAKTAASQTSVNDLPTNTEFEARTLVASAYFDPAADTVAHVTLVDTTTTNTDMRGTDSAYTGTPPTAAEIRTDIDSNSTKLIAIVADTDELQSNQGDWATATSVTVSDKTGFKLSSDGLDSVAITAPSGVASNFREMIVQVWRRFFKRTVRDETTIKTYADDATTALTTQTYTSDGDANDDVGAAT